MIAFLLWLILLAVSWPLALLALVLYPIIWLLLFPLRLFGVTVKVVFEMIYLVITLPIRLLHRLPMRH